LTPQTTSDPPSPKRDTNSQQDTPCHLTVPSQKPLPPTPPSQHANLTGESALDSPLETTSPWYSDSSSAGHSHSTMSIFSTKPTPPHRLNSPYAESRSYSNELNDSNTTIQKSLPKSPGASKLGSFSAGEVLHLQLPLQPLFPRSLFLPYPRPSPPNIISPSLMPPKRQPPETYLPPLMFQRQTQKRTVISEAHIFNYHWQRPRHQYKSKRWRKN
jgi:hypothetical protein